MGKETRPISVPTRDSFQTKDSHRLKVKEWKKIFHANNRDKKAGATVLISDKRDFKVTRDKGEHYIMIKGSVQQEDTTTINMYVCTPNRST